MYSVPLGIMFGADVSKPNLHTYIYIDVLDDRYSLHRANIFASKYLLYISFPQLVTRG